MWLLSTDCAELRFFASPERVDGGYVILSHTWGESERSFQDIQELHKRCSTSGENPRDLVSPKIRGCCLLAEKHGYAWVWIDSCCIDKTSSSELSEAINSMFRWYTCAEVCYAFLHDVPSDCVLDAEGSAFRRARWHTRGWTLQELIAPALLIFVAQDWTTIGKKHVLAPLITEITGVPSAVLTREVSFHSVSIAERMSWASCRNTTRIEDEAYCLMGLFYVNMPTIYGEGRRAFQRLQQEIMKTSFDTSLLAWDDEPLTGLPAGTLQPLDEVQKDCLGDPHAYPLAYSPHIFCRPKNESPVTFTPSRKGSLKPYPPDPEDQTSEETESETSNRRTKGPFGTLELPRFAATNHGIHCRFPIIKVNDGLVIAVLLCETRNAHIGLLLHPADPGEHPQDLTRPTYLCGYLFADRFHRLVNLGPDLYNLRCRGQRVTAKWCSFFILTTLPPWRKDESLNIHAPFNSILPAPPFRIPQWLIGRLQLANLEHDPLFSKVKLPLEDDPIFCAVVSFHDIHGDEAFTVYLGTCMKSGKTRDRVYHWARVFAGLDEETLSDELLYSDSRYHNCSKDHVEQWEDWTKEFGDEERIVRLAFSRCKLDPETTFVLHMELEGPVYNAMKASSKITFPPREPLPEGAGDQEHRRGHVGSSRGRASRRAVGESSSSKHSSSPSATQSPSQSNQHGKTRKSHSRSTQKHATGNAQDVPTGTSKSGRHKAVPP